MEPATELKNGLEDEGPAPTWGEMFASIRNKDAKSWGVTLARIGAIIFFLYFFLVSLDLMGSAFKVLGGCSAGSMFDSNSNPIAGLMIGILATVLVQSSSTSTSIVVALVGASPGMEVKTAVPIIMGANIGTSVTNTIVSMGQMGDPEQFERAFAGATVHDMFNFCAVAILLPLEAATGFLSVITAPMVPTELTKGEKWEGPVKKWVGPLVKQIIMVDKNVIKDVSTSTITCAESYAIGNGLITKKGDITPAFYFENADLNTDMTSGGVLLFISLLLLVLCLGGLVKTLQSIVAGTSHRTLRKATGLHPFFAFLVGIGVTILVQSSSITTSVLTPLVGLNILTVEQMYPLTLGANVGTTCTALLAALVSDKPAGIQIALCHLFFNLIGIIIWYPIPWMRQWPLRAAKQLGHLTRQYRGTPLLYILFAFVLVPGILLGFSSLFARSGPFKVVGAILVAALVLGVLYFLHYYYKRDGKQAILTWMQRRQQQKELHCDLQNIITTLQGEVKDLKVKLDSHDVRVDPPEEKEMQVEEPKATDPLIIA